MSWIFDYLSRLIGQWKFWIVIPPWDIGVRVRLGKVAKTLTAGPHFRVPFLDEIILVNTRQRVCSTACVTLQGLRPGYSVVKSATIGYRIVDPAVAVMRYSGMDLTIVCLVQAELAAQRPIAEIEHRLRDDMKTHGVEVDFVRLVEDVEVKTFRMLNDSWRPSTAHGGEMAGSSSTPVTVRF